ncbi:hypothetical protein D9Q98_002079 [Chlorella vulgaris]|uniref:Uncharacterized protein n=1 Tax=Chlorella vulgaris TaxID=3077 RepID=A0A9D4Z0X0_CHLVU|nr:hypothetical protein D9Q98_002079 [Chlorella vulgaris]
MLPGSRGASPYGLSGFNLDDAAATLPISQQAEQPAVQPDGLIASAAADAAAGAVAAAQACIAEMSARPQESTRAAPTKAESAVRAAATAAAQPLHFVSYRAEVYTRSVASSSADAAVQLQRWMLEDSQSRWHLAVDTVGWDTATQAFSYAAVQPFLLVRPLACSTARDVERYLDQFIPPHKRLHQASAPPPAVPSPAAQQPAQQAQQRPVAADASAPGAAAAARSGTAMQQYAAQLQAAGVKPKRGRPRLHSPKEPQQPKAPAAVGGTPATIASLPPPPSSAGAGAGAGAGGSGAAGNGGGTSGKVSRGRKPRTTLAEAALIKDQERREQVYSLRLEAVLAELALLRVQCGVDYSLTLVGGPGQPLEVITSGTANVQAAKVVRSKRQVERPADELALGAGVQTTAAGQGVLQPHQLLAFQRQYLATQSQQGTPPNSLLLQDWQMQAMQHAAVAANIATQSAAGNDAAAASGGTAGKKRRGRPSNAEKSSAAAATAAAHSKRARNAGRPSPGASEPPPFDDADMEQLARQLQDNAEVYMQGTWRRHPFESEGLEEIEEFVVAEDCGEELDAAALPAKLASDLVPGAERGTGEDLLVLAELPQGLASGEVDVLPVWGIDPFTRNNCWDALALCQQLGAQHSAQLDEVRSHFIDKLLLPALNRQGDHGWDLTRALKQLASSTGDEVTVAAAKLLLQAVKGVEAFHGSTKPEDREWFRVHPKGEGVVLLRASGLPAGAFVAEYVGELYSAWRWLERDPHSRGGRGSSSASKRSIVRLGASDEFFNIALERPPHDGKGFDILFVNAAAKGNFTSRLCHSCEPNCKTMSVVAGGRITVGVFTTRPVAAGEELTLDWACETESESEYGRAVCLCGAPSCRGSFMFLLTTDSAGPLQQYSATHHSFLDRCKLLLQAAQEPQATAEEEACLRRNGFRDSLLTDGFPGQGGVPLPAWLRRWTAAVLAFIEHEAAALPPLLKQQQQRRVAEAVARRQAGEGAEEAQEVDDIDADVETHRKGRLQALAFALDKAKLILRHQEEDGLRQAPPLRMLPEAEAVEFLWTGDESVARRAVSSLADYTDQQHTVGLVRGRKPRNAAPPAWLEGSVQPEMFEGSVNKASSRRMLVTKRQAHNAARLSALPRAPSDTSSGKAGSEAAAGEGGVRRPGRRAAEVAAAGADDSGSETEGDVADKGKEEEEEFETLAEQLDSMIDGTDVKTLAQAQAALRRMAALLRGCGAGHAGLHDVLLLYASVRHWVGQEDYVAFSAKLANGEEGALYRPQHLWAMLSSWWRAGTNADPITWLGNERRGCFNLPDLDCCYLPVFSSGKWASGGQRAALLKHIADSPSAAWPAGGPFKFKTLTRFTAARCWMRCWMAAATRCNGCLRS